MCHDEPIKIKRLQDNWCVGQDEATACRIWNESDKHSNGSFDIVKGKIEKKGNMTATNRFIMKAALDQEMWPVRRLIHGPDIGPANPIRRQCVNQDIRCGNVSARPYTYQFPLSPDFCTNTKSSTVCTPTPLLHVGVNTQNGNVRVIFTVSHPTTPELSGYFGQKTRCPYFLWEIQGYVNAVA
jgi:hypothetical protein